MPTYAYACKNCHHQFEIVQSFSDESLTLCPECSGALRKVFNSVGVVFKGSGFYRTDSRNGSGSTTRAASSAGGSGDGTAASGGKESSSGASESSAKSSGGSAGSTTKSPPATSAASAKKSDVKTS